MSNLPEQNVILKPEFRVVPAKQNYTVLLCIGVIVVAMYKAFKSSEGVKRYIISSSLPTISTDLGIKDTEEEAKKVCIAAAKLFINQLQREQI